MEKISKDKPLPLYYQLKEKLKEKIENEELKPGDPIPPERELCERHDISRMTARKAIMALVNEGLLYRQQGRGTFVADRQSKTRYELSKLSGITKEMEEQGLSTSTDILFFEVKEPTKKVRNNLEISEEIKRVINLRVVKMVEGDSFAIETAWIPFDLCPGMNQEMIEGNSLFEIYEKEYGHQLEYARQRLEPIKLTEYESELLGVNEGDLALLHEQQTYLTNGRIIEYTELIYRSDKYKYEIIID